MYAVYDEDEPGQTELDAAPSAIWIISTAEICISQGDSDYLLLKFPSYALNAPFNNPVHDEGYWAPPFVAYPVPIRYSPPTTIASVRLLVDRVLSHLDVEGGIEHLLYQMGLRDVQIERRTTFMELKVSPRSPDQVKIFYFLRHGLISLDDACKRNLADPEVRRGYVFCPINPLSEMISIRASQTHLRDERWFLGKPLQSNIEKVLDTSSMRHTVQVSGIQLQPELFRRTEQGLVIVVDLSGYGAALKYARERMHTFNVSGAGAADEFSGSVAEILQVMLGRLGVTQAQIAGDGFVCAMPNRVFDNTRVAINHLLSTWELAIQSINELSGSISDVTRTVGSRISIHYGDYLYGRIGGAKSFLAAFDGQSIVDVVRMDQGLASYAKSARKVDSPATHLAALSGEVIVTLQGDSLGHGWTEIEQTNLASKESEIQASIYEIGPRDERRGE